MATQNVSEEQLQSQFTYIDAVARLLGDKRPKAYTHTFGCQQNEADTERIRGMLSEMGYEMTDTPDEADFILFNTCAVREHAEDRAFGNVGALRHLKKERPGIVIAMCGCMAQQEKNVEKIKKSYPQVNLLFGTHALWRFPSLLYRVLTEKKRVFDIGGEDDIAEGLPVLRAKGAKAWLSIMYGCNNFCTYCIVPYVRGRERSREPEQILEEVRSLVAEGYKDITLLGQNVNSYGKDLDSNVDFADLLAQINDIPGDFLVRFMTSHPKDASQKLFETMARCDKVAPQLHLPVQSGSSRVLKAMNRHYDREIYLDEVRRLKALIPDIVLTSDIIVGFPGETQEEFEETLSLLEEVRFDSLFTFIFSPRVGTPAAKMDDPVPMEEKKKWFQRLLDTQNRISVEKHKEYIGRILPVLVEEENPADAVNNLNCRTDGWRLVHVPGDVSLLGQRKKVKITDCSTWSLFGEFVEE